MSSCQNILYNCDPDDANCLCADVTNVSTCFCDWGYVLDPDYPPAIGKMKFCTKFCKGGHLNCWTSTTSHTICPIGGVDCVCAFGYTAVLRDELVSFNKTDKHLKNSCASFEMPDQISTEPDWFYCEIFCAMFSFAIPDFQFWSLKSL